MLILPPFRFCNETDNLSGTPAVDPTSFSAGANSADGASVSVLAAVPHDVHYLVVGIYDVHLATTNCKGLLDILVDPAGGTSWSQFIDDLLCGFSQSGVSATIPCTVYYHFPIWIKSGSSIGVRARTSHTAAITGRVYMWAYGNPSRPDMWWCGTKVESLGITAASSAGTTITAGASGTYSSWQNLGSTTSGRYGAVQIGLQGLDGSMSGFGYYIQIGSGASQCPGTPTVYCAQATTEDQPKTGFRMPIWCDLPQGTQLQARATANGASPESLDMAIYGVM